MQRTTLCAGLALLFAFTPVRARADTILDTKTYAGCYSDAHVTTCLSVPYALVNLLPLVNVNTTKVLAPITYNPLLLTPNTFFFPVYQLFPVGYVVDPPDGHIGFGVVGNFGFEQYRTLQFTLPQTLTLRFAEIVDCPFTPSPENLCGLLLDPEGPIESPHNPYVHNVEIALTAVPEPDTASYLLLGLLVVGAAAKKIREVTS